jgi:hypothetical protein
MTIVLSIICVNDESVGYYPKKQSKLKETIVNEILPKLPKNNHLRSLTKDK